MAEHIPEQDHGIYKTPEKVRYDLEKDYAMEDYNDLVSALDALLERNTKLKQDIHSGEWLAQLEGALDAACRDPDRGEREKRTAMDALSDLGSAQAALGANGMTETAHEAIFHAFQAGRAMEQVYVMPYEEETKTGRKHKDNQRKKAEHRWSTANHFQEKVQEHYQRLIDNGGGTRPELAEAKREILRILTDNWPKFGKLTGAPERPPKLRKIQRWVRGIKPRHD